MHEDDDRRSIDLLVREFYSVFENRGGRAPRLETLRTICLPDCVITRATAGARTHRVVRQRRAPRSDVSQGGPPPERAVFRPWHVAVEWLTQ